MWLDLRDRVPLLPLWVITTVVFPVAGAAILKLPKFYSLTTRGISTQARVTQLEPLNHNGVDYSYQVNGVSYPGAGSASTIGRQAETMTIGENIPIVYDPANAYSCSLGDPFKQLKSIIYGVILLAVSPTIGVLVLYLRRAAKSTAAT